MRPVRLVMSAFGSYAGRTEIDFKNAAEGVFLITGDTGSGKTTIFDAITYALYDETSGGMRSGAMMRSQYAASDVKTFVEFAFDYQGDVYTVRRNPEYRISKTLKNGKEKEQKVAASVELTLPDGSVFPEKKKETDAKIAEIIGLDVRQFTQIAMIAQGDFLKLLYTKTEERKLIFSRIFQTTLYYRVQENLKKRFFALEEKLGYNTQAILQEVGKIRCEDEELKGQLVTLREHVVLSAQSYCEVTEEICKRGKMAECEAKREQEAAAKEVRELTASLAKAEEQEKIACQLARAREKLEAILPSEKLLKDAVEQATAKRKEKEPALQEKRLAAKQALEKFREFTGKEQAEKKLRAEWEALKKEVSVIETELNELEKQQELSEQQLQFLKDAEAELFSAAEQEKNCVGRREELELLEELDRREVQENEKTEQSKNALLLAEEEAKRLIFSYETDYELFLKAQAGILAEQLKEGVPCPVCGAMKHPSPAALPENAPSGEVIKREKEESERAKEKRENCHLAFVRQTEQALALKQQKEEQWKRCMGEAKDVRQALAEAKVKEQEAVAARKTAKKRADRKKSLEEEAGKRKELLMAYRKKFEEKKAACTEAELACAKAEKELLVWKETLAFPGKKEAEEAFDFAEKQLKNLEAEEKRAQKAYRDWEEECSLLKGNIAAGQKALRGKAQVDVLELKQTLAQKIKLQKEAEKKFAGLHSQSTSNEGILAELRKYAAEREDLESEAEVVQILNRTANGRISGAAKLDLETYVQRQYFRQIIAQANRRLVDMSCGQFILKLKDSEAAGKGKNEGLDLSVYSLVTDTVRDVKTLSGGEAFMAALSMALGLADIVQRTAGAVHLDMMFIDEGFGSLDENARTQAIGVLNELAGDSRVVGIISHVTELKDSIEKKLVVEKTEKGSTVSWG